MKTQPQKSLAIVVLNKLEDKLNRQIEKAWNPNTKDRLEERRATLQFMRKAILAYEEKDTC